MLFPIYIIFITTGKGAGNSAEPNVLFAIIPEPLKVLLSICLVYMILEDNQVKLPNDPLTGEPRTIEDFQKVEL